jgi:Na+/proline symporter
MQVVIACVSGFYMFIFIVAELTAISSVFALLTNQESTKYGIIITVSLGAFTVFYTTIAGLPASIVTDKFQGIMMGILVIMLTIAVTVNPQNRVSRSEFALASNWTVEGFYAAVTLVIAIACAELFNQGTWQRVWAAESVPAMRKGFALGSVMVFVLMMVRSMLCIHENAKTIVI